MPPSGRSARYSALPYCFFHIAVAQEEHITRSAAADYENNDQYNTPPGKSYAILALNDLII